MRTTIFKAEYLEMISKQEYRLDRIQWRKRKHKFHFAFMIKHFMNSVEKVEEKKSLF